MRARLSMAGALAALAIALPAFAQGNSANQKTKIPNKNRLLTRGTGSSPVALIDDASLLERGSAAFSLSVMRWQGSGVSEVDAPIVYVAAGLHPRFQISASVPRVVGSDDPNGSAGGLGTVYISGKIGLVNDSTTGFKVAFGPTMEILSSETVAGTDSSRAQIGLPLSIELDRGARRVYAGLGYYSNGSFFAGFGAGIQAAPKVSVSLGFSRAWTRASATEAASSRNEVSFGVTRSLATLVSVYGSISQSVATLDENGAGTTLAAGISLYVPSGTLFK